MKANWKTTLGGIITAAGTGMSQVDDPIIRTVGIVLMAIGPLILGTSAKDHAAPATE